MITYSTLCIMLPGAILLHVTEEFLFPGGFYEWYKKLVPPKNEKGLNSGYSVEEWIFGFPFLLLPQLMLVFIFGAF